MSADVRTALVVGGGIAGLTAAMALQKAGVEARVHEAHDSAAEGVGGGLSIAPNGLQALEAIDAADAVRAVGAPLHGTVLESRTGTVLGELTTPAELPPMQFVWRADLHRALLEKARARGVQVVPSQRLATAADHGGDASGRDGVTATFDDGTRASADILVGADGIRSTVRDLIDPAAPEPQYAGLLGFAATVAHTGRAPTEGKLRICYGRQMSFGYLVHDDGSGGWFANLPHREALTAAEARQQGTEHWLGALRAAVAEDQSPAPDMLHRTDADDLLVTGPLETLPTVPAWSRGRMVLVGDAVHAASPSSGQGASLAMESAVQLARCLRDLPHREAFAAYEDLRRARVERIVAGATRTNRNKASPVVRALRDALMPVAMKAAARFVKPEKKMRWQFAHHIDWDATVTGGHRVDAGRR